MNGRERACQKVLSLFLLFRVLTRVSEAPVPLMLRCRIVPCEDAASYVAWVSNLSPERLLTVHLTRY